MTVVVIPEAGLTQFKHNCPSARGVGVGVRRGPGDNEEWRGLGGSVALVEGEKQRGVCGGIPAKGQSYQEWREVRCDSTVLL